MGNYDNYGLLIDYKYCTNCHSCEIACQQEKGLAPDEFGIRILELKPERKPGNLIDDAWDWSYIATPTWRCDLCAERMDQGKKPMCVKHCLAACMEVGPMNELAKKAQGMGDRVVLFKPAGAKIIDIGTIGPEMLSGEAYDPAEYRREATSSSGMMEEDNEWETRDYRIVLQPDEINYDAFVELSDEDRIEFLQGEILRGKDPDKVLAEIGLTPQSLSNFDIVILGRQVKPIPKKNTI